MTSIYILINRGGVETRCFETEMRRDFRVARSRPDETLEYRNRDETQTLHNLF